MNITRAQAIDLAKALLDEKGSLYFTDTVTQQLADEANRMVYRLIVESNPEHFLTSVEFVFPSGTEKLDITTKTVGSELPYKIISLEHFETSGGVTVDNLPRKWSPMRFQDRSKRLQESHEIYTNYKIYYAFQKNYLYVAPLLSESRSVICHYVRQLPRFSADGDAVLDGSAQMFHDAVAYALAWLMNVKQNIQNPGIDMLWQNAQMQIKEHAITRNVDEPWEVRVMGHY